MRFLASRLFAGLAALAAVAAPAAAQDIAVALTTPAVEVDAGFAGARVVLFGALTGPDAPGANDDATPTDIVAVVRGPETTFSIRPIERDGMIWVKGPAVRLDAPGLLLTHSSRPLDDIAPPELRRVLMITADAGDLARDAAATNPAAAARLEARGRDAFGEAFIAASRIAGAMRDRPNAVTTHKGALFSIEIDLPPTTPLGAYRVDVYLFSEGALVSRDSAALVVNKVGLERRIYDLAHERPIAYGIACVAVSLLAGWLAALAFRK